MTADEYDNCLELEAEEYAYEHELKRDGMVAFLDILGYGNLAKTASESVIFDVMSALKQAQDETAKLTPELDLPEDLLVQLGMCDIDDVKLINISDSIILHSRNLFAIPFGPKGAERMKICEAFAVYRFVKLCKHIWGILFERGLPLRGAIAFGTFYWNHETMLAGQPFIEAHDESESLSFSGLIFAKDSLSAIRKRADFLFQKECPPEMRFLTRQMAVPVKTKSGDGLVLRDVVVPEFQDMPDEKLAEYVRDRFGAYDKKTDLPRVQAIIKNTIDVLRGMKGKDKL